MDHGLHLGRRLSRSGMGRERDAAADDDLLPRLHFPGRPRLSAARGIQPRLDVQEDRRARKTIADHGNGIWMQRGRRDRNSRDQLSARTIDRHPDE